MRRRAQGIWVAPPVLLVPLFWLVLLAFPCQSLSLFSRLACHCFSFAGTFAPDNATQCLPCPNGTISGLASAQCTPCTAGTYAFERLSCVLCERGEASSVEQVTACQSCAPGYFAERRGLTRCEVCLPGFFAAAASAVECAAAQAGKVVPHAGGAVEEGCPAGSFSEKAAVNCTPCAPPTYSTQPNASFCLSCPVGQYPWFQQSTGIFQSCDDCPSGLTCSGGQLPRPQLGFFMATDAEGRLTAAACLGAECREDGTCSADRLQPASANPLCGQCREELYSWNGACTSCDDGLWRNLIVVYVLAIWAYVLFIHIISQAREGEASIKIFLFFVSSARLMLRSESRWLAWLDFLDFSPQAASNKVCFLPLDLYEQLALNAALPFLFLGLLLATFLVQSAVGICKPAFKPKPHMYIRSSISLAIFSYTQLAALSLGYFDCLQVGNYMVNRSHPAIQCDSEAYNKNLPIIIALLIFPVATFPPLVALMLAKYRKHFSSTYNGPPSATRVWLDNYVGILYETYHQQFFWWEAVALLRRTVLVALIVYISNPTYRSQALVMLMLLLLLLQVKLRPFRYEDDNFFEVCSLGTLTLVSVVQTGFPETTLPTLVQQFITTLVVLYMLSWMLYRFLVILQKSKMHQTHLAHAPLLDRHIPKSKRDLINGDVRASSQERIVGWEGGVEEEILATTDGLASEAENVQSQGHNGDAHSPDGGHTVEKTEAEHGERQSLKLNDAHDTDSVVEPPEPEASDRERKSLDDSLVQPPE